MAKSRRLVTVGFQATYKFALTLYYIKDKHTRYSQSYSGV